MTGSRSACYMVPLLLLSLALRCASGSPGGWEPSTDGLDLPVVQPTYTPPEARAAQLQAIPDAPPPLASVPPEEDPEPVLFYGQEITPEQSSIVYVLDFSGSMGVHTAGSRIVQDSPTSTHTIPVFYSDQLKEEFARSVGGLSSATKFNVISYSCGVLQWHAELTRATPAAKQSAIAWVDAQEPQGGTGTSAALVAALSDPEVHAVVLLTDGVPNCELSREEHLAAIRVANDQRAPVHCFGLGREPQADPFLLTVATDSGGTYTELP